MLIFFSMKKVLLVDDVKLFLELEKTLLNRSNLQIFTASSGQEALEIHKREKADLILCDLYMPGMNGDEVCKYTSQARYSYTGKNRCPGFEGDGAGIVPGEHIEYQHERCPD